MTVHQQPLRLDLGFTLNLPIGSRRAFPFAFPSLHLPPDLTLVDFTCQADVSRNNQGLLIEVDAAGTTDAECVRCLSPFPYTLQTSFTERLVFSPKSASEEDLILPQDGKLDLGPLVREYLILEMPISPVCRPDCKGLCPVCGENRNETDCQHDAEDIDPRLAGLQILLEE